MSAGVRAIALPLISDEGTPTGPERGVVERRFINRR